PAPKSKQIAPFSRSSSISVPMPVAICFDFGAGVTTAAVYMNGVPAWLGLVPAGGAHVTSDIAQGLGTTFAAAERLKTVHGVTDPGAPGHAERIDCPKLGDDGRLHAARMPRQDLSNIIAPRIEETLEILLGLMSASALKKVLPRRGVLTGGASQISGLRDTAKSVLSMPVRLGRPINADRLGEGFANPAFSTAAGLLTYHIADLPDALRASAQVGAAGMAGDGSIVKKAFFWMRENF
ncbi:MAG: cell division FtsA domain-containing protein, partial [Pseudomonadota bacterium]